MRNGVIVAAIIPALNEEAALPGVIASIPEWVERIIVVDNGSTDQTGSVARAAGAVVISEPTRGYGRACQAGIAHASDGPHVSPDVLVFLDADGSDVPEQMHRLVDPIAAGRADMVIGSRTRGTLTPGAMTAPQRLGNALAPALIHWLWGERYSDLGPFRAIRFSSLRSLRMDDNTYGWTVQMQIRAARAGLRAMEVPVDYRRRRAGKSKISGTVRGVVKAGMKILSCVGQEYLLPTPLAVPGREAIAVFAKFPEPGRVKTRLIPGLGADGAAALHDQMVRHTLDRVGELCLAREVEARVFSAGVEPARFADHFKVHIPCVPQTDADLGTRMHTAFQHMLRDASSAIIIGTDCPDISQGLLGMAFDAMKCSDLVLGPAADGGYYLIGLRRPVPALFENMEWSTASVLSETLARAATLGLRVRTLPTLSDVDDPDDVAAWDRVRATISPTGEAPALSVIIPTLNEEARIGGLVAEVRQPGVEVIVADGGSRDRTREAAAAQGARVIIAPRGRGPQLNAGAALARGRDLLFLHADTILPANFPVVVRRTLRDPAIAVGAFQFKLDREGARFRFVELAVGARCRLLRAPYGDQAMFMRREMFNRLRGFAAIPLMEDLDMVRRARRVGRVTLAQTHAMTSARRWDEIGVVRMTAINQACVVGFSLGLSPERLATWRNRLSGRRASKNRPSYPEAAHTVPDGSLAPNAARAVRMVSSDSDVRE